MGTYIVGCDSASRISRDQFELHINLAKEILILGLETRSRGLVKGKSEKLSIVEYLTTPIPPSDIKVLVEVTC